EPNVARLAITGAPLGLHPADTPARNLAVDDGLPLGNHRSYSESELLTLPVLEQLAPGVGVGTFRDVHQEPIAVDLDVRPPGPLDDLQPAAGAPDIVRFTADHLAR